MNTLARLFAECNKECYGSYTRTKKLDRFIALERKLTKAQIDLEDYTLTTFIDRKYIASKVGYLPANVFTSDKSYRRYLDRVRQGVNARCKLKEPLKDYLSMELYLGETIIGCILQRQEFTDDELCLLSGLHPSYMNDQRRPVDQAQALLAMKHQTPVGSYIEIALYRRNRVESDFQKESNRSTTRKSLVG